MPETFGGRLKSAWNAFMNRDPPAQSIGSSYSYRPDRMQMSRGNERSIVTSVYNRISMDVAAIGIQHVQLDEKGRYAKTLDTRLNRCLTLNANKDQTARAFVQDAVLSMFDEGCVALVPIDTIEGVAKGDRSYDIASLRVAKITQWYPDHVRLRVYNDRSGETTELLMPKSAVAILENPLYAIMNEQNSTVRRLTHKLALLDAVDEQSSSGKLDLIIQVPYSIKTAARRQEAENRRIDIENQLKGSKYGIAYTDGTERITQLNRSLDNNLMKQVEYLTEQFYDQLGITKEIMNGTADEAAMQNYYSRSIEPVISTIVEAERWKFLTEKNRKDGEDIQFFRDPFKLIPVTEMANIADKMTRNEIMSSNEVRQKIGMMPSDDPGADELRNKNLNASKAVQAQLDQKRSDLTKQEVSSE